MDDFAISISDSIASEAEDRLRRQDDFERLKVHAAEYGYYVPTNVPYDGDCFFHAVCYHLGRSDAKLLRSQLSSFLETKVATFSKFKIN